MKFWALSSDSANCFAICTVLIRYSQMLYRTYFFMLLIFLSLPSYCPIPTNTPYYYLLTFFSFCFFRLLNHKNMGMLPGTAQHCTSSAAAAVKTCERNINLPQSVLHEEHYKGNEEWLLRTGKFELEDRSSSSCGSLGEKWACTLDKPQQHLRISSQLHQNSRNQNTC